MTQIVPGARSPAARFFCPAAWACQLGATGRLRQSVPAAARRGDLVPTGLRQPARHPASRRQLPIRLAMAVSRSFRLSRPMLQAPLSRRWQRRRAATPRPFGLTCRRRETTRSAAPCRKLAPHLNPWRCSLFVQRFLDLPPPRRLAILRGCAIGFGLAGVPGFWSSSCGRDRASSSSAAPDTAGSCAARPRLATHRSSSSSSAAKSRP